MNKDQPITTGDERGKHEATDKDAIPTYVRNYEGNHTRNLE
jgi:hypothetical protein